MFYDAPSSTLIQTNPDAINYFTNNPLSATFHANLIDFPAGLYREQAVGQMYLIACEWLKPLRDEIADKAKPEKDRKPKSWTDGIVLANFDRKLPTFDAEGRALQTLEKVYFSDPTGPSTTMASSPHPRERIDRGPPPPELDAVAVHVEFASAPTAGPERFLDVVSDREARRSSDW